LNVERKIHDPKIAMKIKNLFCSLALAAGTALPPASLLAGDSMTITNEVKIDNFVFGPQTLTVPVGTKVTWINKDDIPHTVTSDAKLFASRALDTDDKFTFSFTTPGTNNYYCSMHPRMTGQIIVK
jgi:plastocyanin